MNTYYPVWQHCSQNRQHDDMSCLNNTIRIVELWPNSSYSQNEFMSNDYGIEKENEVVV